MTSELFGSRTKLAWLTVAVLLAVALGALSAPWPVTMNGRSSGDAELAAQVRQLAAGKAQAGMAVAVLEDGELRQAGLGATGAGADVRPATRFEIGSATKTLTAALLADLAADGVVEPSDTVREVVPDRTWRKGGIGDVTLAELASHRSGLPKVPTGAGTIVDSLGYGLLGLNPYAGTTPDDVFDAAEAANRPTAGEHAYSNLGFALLGHVLAAKTGEPYPELLRARLLDPLGMDATAIPADPADLSGDVAAGHRTDGRRVQPWVSQGDAPAGAGVWSDVADLATFAEQVMRGTAPGASAAKPRYPAGDSQRIGYAWVTSPQKGGGSIVWHNGEAGGCSSFFGFDRATGRVVAVLSNSTTSVDDLGIRLLTGAGAVTAAKPRLLAVLIGLALPPTAGLAFLGASGAGGRRGKRRTPDRARVLAAAGEAVIMFAVVVAAGAASAWNVVGWLAGSAICGAAVFAAAVRWRQLPWNVAKRPRLHWAGTAVSVGCALALAVGVAVTG